MTDPLLPDNPVLRQVADTMKAYLAGALPVDQAARQIHDLTRGLPIGVGGAGPDSRQRISDLIATLRTLDGLQLRSVAPQFVVPDVVRTAEYYRDRFGFEIAGYFLDPPVHAIVKRGPGVELFFSKAAAAAGMPNHQLKPEAIDAYIRVSGLDLLVEEFQRRGAVVLDGPVVRSYRMREITVEDCNGFRLVFGEDA